MKAYVLLCHVFLTSLKSEAHVSIVTYSEQKYCHVLGVVTIDGVWIG
jgi:hypothetical protein